MRTIKFRIENANQLQLTVPLIWTSTENKISNSLNLSANLMLNNFLLYMNSSHHRYLYNCDRVHVDYYISNKSLGCPQLTNDDWKQKMHNSLPHTKCQLVMTWNHDFKAIRPIVANLVHSITGSSLFVSMPRKLATSYPCCLWKRLTGWQTNTLRYMWL